MNILSIYYLIFLFFSVAVYYLLPKKVQWCWLLAISFAFFLLCSGWLMVPYLAFGVLVTYFGAAAISRTEDPKKRKSLLLLTLGLTLGELTFLKYLNIFPSIGNFAAGLMGKGAPFETISILAPMGVSYYTLSIVGYVLDVYWKSHPVQTNVMKHALFTCYYPQTISGPVTRYGSMRKELFEEKRFDYNTVVFGFQRVMWGYFKKLLIAENLIGFVQMIYGDYASYAGSDLLVATVCYAFYLYGDFSGCMDIVLGSSEMFGVKLPENFQRPFFSRTIDEFWRRWHISLGAWLKDYLLYPLLKSDTMQSIKRACKEKWGRKASKSIPTYLGLCVLWVTVGFWHQGSIKYVVGSGILPGAYLMLGDALTPYFKNLTTRLRINTETFGYRLFGRLRTFCLACTIFFITNSPSLAEAWRTVKHATANFGPLAWVDTILVRAGIFAVPGAAVLALFAVSLLEEKGCDVRRALAKQPLALRWFVYLAVIFAVLMLSPDLTGGFGEFMYAQF